MARIATLATATIDTESYICSACKEPIDIHDDYVDGPDDRCTVIEDGLTCEVCDDGVHRRCFNEQAYACDACVASGKAA
jgi:hypothetical protein